MKKIITLFVLFFAFSINASAQDSQDKSVPVEVKAKKDLESLMSIVTLDNTMQTAIFNLFIHKHRELESSDMTNSKRIQISSVIDAKLRASLTNDQMITLEKHKDIYAQVISQVPSTENGKKK